ncbi:MAG TPA: glycoside hydrolase family protein [Sphingopyxis sp.]|uniref:glycoside hydrolase family protein n=1 Tax=Sphingopyxis sp. TaxID=1908224 RepID=UPI002C5B45D3|nr:glycoside hydrolase family protein [Sphingopyxis sp.]HWW56348.1 glycoside hydrolase family protein [Sphingopyxis sp.]
MTDARTIFETVRPWLDAKGFTPDRIAALDAAIAGAPAPVTPIPTAADLTPFDRAIEAHLRVEEGDKARAYKDHLGYWTIGIGRLIDPRKGGRITAEENAILLANDPSRRGGTIMDWTLTSAERSMLLKNDVKRFTDAMKDWPSWKRVQSDVPRMVAMASMCFQIGVEGYRDFVNTHKMIAAGQFASAADNMLKSLWAKQTPERAARVAAMMRTGK